MKKLIIISILWVRVSSLHAQTPSSGTNAVMEQTPRVEMTTVVGSTHTTVQSAIQYFDKLGRPSQTVLYRASPDAQKDILSSTTQYDAFGRAYKAILPTPSDVLTGAYNSTALTLATTFYNNDANPFSETVFETSPANRPIKGFGAGQAWRTANKSVGTSYLIADAGEVPLWNVSSTGASKISGGYGAGQLLKTETTSEQGNKVVEYKDKDGNIVRKDVEYESGKFMRTLYLYDDFLRLRYVVQPNAYETLLTQTSFTESSTVYLEGIFSYKYDDLGRITESHIVGAGTKRLVYDKNDRVVLENDDRDANILPANKNYYKFMKYDALGRKIQGGLIFGIGNFLRSQLQTDFDNHTGNTYETITNTGGLFGYTNTSFPSSYRPDNDNVKEVVYYDNYGFISDTASYNFKSAKAFHVKASAKGMVTGKLIRNLITNTWQRMILYYDYKGRNIQDFHLSNKGNIIRKDYQYSFNGELLRTRIVKGSTIKLFVYEYDHISRKVKFKHSINGVLQNVTSYSLDQIGRLSKKIFKGSDAVSSKQTGNWTDVSTWLSNGLPTVSDIVTINSGQTITIPTGESASAGKLNDNGLLKNFGMLNFGKIGVNPLYEIAYKYHIRGSITGINTDANNNLTNSLFSFRLEFENDGTYFDGNIRKQSWKSSIDNQQRDFTYSYDGALRLKSGAFTSTKSGENYSLNNMDYDKNGNITNLSRSGLRTNNSFGLIDNLNYTYNVNSNKILKVDDTSNEIASFKDVTGNDYTYWEDGSLKSDNNKGIDSIKYNYLKLPERIKFATGKWINYEYDAEGTKLKKTLSTGKVTDYEEDDIYENNVLYQTTHDEGRIVNGVYEYNIADHLGNLRVAFRDSLGIAKITQVNAYGAFGEDLPTLKYINSLKINGFNFNGKEVENDFDSGFIDFKWRFSDPILGRFFTIDRLAEKFYYLSTFQFASNDPINKIELDGLEGVPYYSPTAEVQRKAESAYNGFVNQVSSTYNSVSNSVNSVLDSKTFNGAKNLTFGVIGMIGSGAYVVGTEGVGAAAGGATAFTLATGEAGIGLAQLLDANSPNPGNQDLHEVGSLPGLVAQSSGSNHTALIDATGQFATGALSGGNVNGMIDAGKEIIKGNNIVSNTLNVKDAYDDTKGFVTQGVKSLTNFSNGYTSTKSYGQGIAPSDATRVNTIPKVIQKK